MQMGQIQRLHRLSNGLCQALGGRGIGVWQYQQEHFTAIARRQVASASHARVDGLRHALETFVTRLMAVVVVVALELVDIDHDQCQRLIGSPGSDPFAGQRVVQATPVCQASQFIPCRQNTIEFVGPVLGHEQESDRQQHHDNQDRQNTNGLDRTRSRQGDHGGRRAARCLHGAQQQNGHRNEQSGHQEIFATPGRTVTLLPHQPQGQHILGREDQADDDDAQGQVFAGECKGEQDGSDGRPDQRPRRPAPVELAEPFGKRSPGAGTQHVGVKEGGNFPDPADLAENKQGRRVHGQSDSPIDHAIALASPGDGSNGDGQDTADQNDDQQQGRRLRGQ